ncbi:MAG: ABC transporter permease subunit, partial [Mycetocola sp.]
QLPWLAVTIVVGVLVLLPLLPLMSQVLADGGAGLREFVAYPGVLRLFANTLLLGVGAVVFALALGTLLALSVNYLPQRWAGIAAVPPMLPMLIPGVAHAVGFIFLFSPETGYVNTALRATPFFSDLTTGPINVYTGFWIIAYTGLHLTSFVFLFIYTGLRDLGDDFALASRVNGAGPFRTLFRVTLPMLRPTFIYASAVAFLLAMGQFTGPLMLGRRENWNVITTEMYNLVTEPPVNFPLGASFGAPLFLLAILLVWVQRRLVGDQKRFVGRGNASLLKAPRNRLIVAFNVSFIVIFAIVSAVLPLLALVYVAFSRFWSGKLDFQGLTLDTFTRVLSDRSVHQAILTSLFASLVAVVIVTVVGMLVAFTLFNRTNVHPWVASLLDVFASMPLSVPAALFGFGFLFAYVQIPGMYGSPWGLAIAYVTIMIPFAMRYQLGSLVSIGGEAIEASRANGGGVLRTFAHVILPLTRRGVLAGVAIVFVLLIQEFGSSLMLRAPGTSVMSVKLYDLFNGGLYPGVAVMGLIMTVITAAGVSVALGFGGRKALV